MRRGRRYREDAPVPGASRATVCTPCTLRARSTGVDSSKLAPIPVSTSSGDPVPRTEVRSRTPSTSTYRICGSSSGEGADTGDVPSDDQRLHGLGALVGVDDLDVAHVPDDVVLEQHAVTAQHVARLGDDLPCLARVVELGEAGDRVGEAAVLLQSRELHAVELHPGDLGEHLDEAVLDDLEAAQRLAELQAL